MKRLFTLILLSLWATCLPARLEAQVLPPLDISGKVVDLDGEPIAGAKIYLTHYLSQDEEARRLLDDEGLDVVLDHDESDEEGYYRVTAPRPGPFKVIIVGTSKRAIWRSTGALAAPTVLPPARLSPSEGMALRLRDHESNPLSYAYVLARPEKDSDTVPKGWRAYDQPRQTSETGEVVVPRGVGEKIWLWVLQEGLVPFGLDIPGSTGPQIDPGARYVLNVVDGEGLPASGALVRWGTLPLGRTDENGTIEVRASPAGVNLNVRHGEASASLKVGSEAAAAAANAEVNAETNTAQGEKTQSPPLVEASRDSEDASAVEPTRLTVHLAPPRRLGGTVVDKNSGRPIADAVLWSWRAPENTAQSDHRGAFELARVPSGELSVEVLAAGYHPANIAVDSETLELPDIKLEPELHVAGVIRDLQGLPVAAAEISVIPVGNAFRFDRPPTLQRSDKEGRFHISGLSFDTPFELRAEAPDFATRYHRLPPLEIGAVYDELEIILAPSLRAFGRVVDPRDRPIARADVELWQIPGGSEPGAIFRQLTRKPKPMRASTDGEGFFEIPDLDPGTYFLRAKAQGFAPTRVPGLQLESNPLEPNPGPIDLGTVMVARGTRFEGRVVDPDDQPIVGVSVSARSAHEDFSTLLESSTGDPESQVTDSDGLFFFEDLVPGQTLRLELEKEDWIAEPTEVTVSENDDEEPVRIVMEAAAWLEIRVHDDDGVPLPGARVTARLASRFKSRTTDQNGRAFIKPLLAGRYSIDTRRDGYRAQKRTAVVEPGGTSLTIALSRGLVLRGTVLDPEGRPVEGAAVTMKDGDRLSATSDPEGRFVLEGVSEGAHQVQAEHEKWGLATVSLAQIPEEGTVVIRFDRGVELRGLVLDGDSGEPVPGATVQLNSGGGSSLFTAPHVSSTASNAQGRFIFDNIPPGRYTLWAELDGFAVSSGESFDVESTPLSSLRIELNRGTTISGRVLGVEFDELSSTAIGAISQTGGFKTATVDYEGHFRLEHLSAGTWFVHASSGTRQQSKAVEVKPGDGELEIEINLDSGQTVHGEVRSDGNPAAGVKVTVHQVEGLVTANSRTKADGTFALHGLEPGLYRVRLKSSSGELLLRTERALEGPWVFDLNGARLSGRVVDSAGRGLTHVVIDLYSPQASDQRLWIRDTTSDSSGAFDLGAVSTGRHWITARKRGFAKVEHQLDLPAAGMQDFEIVLQRSAGLTLRPTRSRGGRPAFLVIAIPRSGGGHQVANYSVDTAGDVRLDHLASGIHEILVAESGGPSHTVRVEVPGDVVSVELAQGGQLHLDASALFDSQAQMTARLLGADGEPHHSIESLGGNLPTLLSGGVWTLPLLPGAYEVVIETEDGGPWQERFTIVEGRLTEVSLP